MDSLSPAVLEYAAAAVKAVGCGYDLARDLRLSDSKSRDFGKRLIDIDDILVHDLVLPGGGVINDVPKSIKCDKGERTRFRSDILNFQQMSEQFNQNISLSGKIPSGFFNSMFDFHGCWQKDLSTAKTLAFDGWFVTLYSIELARSQIILHDKVKEDVPSSWNPAALAQFIEKYGTHIIVGVKMGGKDVTYLKQLQDSSLQPTEVQNVLKDLADDSFSKDFNPNFLFRQADISRKMKDLRAVKLRNNGAILKSTSSSVVTHWKNDNLVSNHVRVGGINANQSHDQWLPTVSQAPNVISMSFVPITTLLTGLHGSGFVSHAMNLYLRYKPAIEELHHFLELQLPRQWAPLFGEIPIGPQHIKRRRFPALQFTLLGPKLHVNTTQVESKNRPVTGLRLFLEGSRSNCLAIHLQHLSTSPDSFHFSEECNSTSTDSPSSEDPRPFFVPIKWALLSHVCTAPVQQTSSSIDSPPVSIVTKARLEVQNVGVRRVLFLRLGFSTLIGMKTRTSQWDGPTNLTQNSGPLSAMINYRFSMGMVPEEKKKKTEVNSAVYPKGPPVPVRDRKMSRFVDMTELCRGPNDLPGYWLVTGAKLCVDNGAICLNAKYSLVVHKSEEEF